MTDEHRHAWAVVDFGIAGGRPMMLQRCGCGSERQVRAFDRTWHPSSSAEITAHDRTEDDAPEGDAGTPRSAQ